MVFTKRNHTHIHLLFLPIVSSRQYIFPDNMFSYKHILSFISSMNAHFRRPIKVSLSRDNLHCLQYFQNNKYLPNPGNYSSG